MLKPHHFSFKCPLKISDLEKTEDGHFCAKCSKDIYDLTDCSLEEVIELQRRKGSLCGFVRALSLTSMVGLAACSDTEKTSQTESGNSNTAPTPEQSVPVNVHPELMGDICIPEHEVPKPAPNPAPQEEASPAPDDAQADAGDKPVEPKPEVIQIRGELMGKICVPQQLIPEEPKPLDPHREGSPG